MRKIKSTLDNFNNFIDDNFFNDYHNWILWLPVLFSAGILLYFSSSYYNSYMGYSATVLSLLLPIIFHKNTKFLIIFIAFSAFLLGYVRAGSYTVALDSPTIKYKMGYAKIYGTIEDVSYYQKYGDSKKRLIVKVDKIEKYKKPEKDDRVRNNMTPYFTKDGLMHNTPKYLRVNINNKKYQPKFGDYVEIRANLIPIPKQAFPGSYNIERLFYFQQIGGIGYNGYVYNHYQPENQSLYAKIRNRTYNIRENINNRIIATIGEKSGAVVGSFITGIRGKIDAEDYNNMTYAGLAHLIAISGLNMAIIMGLAFSICRRILVQSEYLALRFNIKRISAVVAIVAGFLYLSITGFPVSANRAYIMSVLFFIGIILERETDTMRFLCLAAMLILFNEPNLVLDPSFQLSFFAVIGLISGFKFLKDHDIHTYTTNKYLKPFYYFFAVFVSSIITEISVTPIAIYHFNNYTPYNMITNMIAIPLAGFITLPFATLSILLFPPHLEKYLLIPAGWAIDIILRLSKYVVDLPGGVHIVSSPSIFGLAFIIFGFLWFALWEQKWRYFGVLLFVLGIAFSIFKRVPDVIIDKEDKFVIIVAKNGDLYFSNDKNHYKISIIEKKMGETGHKKLADYCNIVKNKDDCMNFVENIDYTFRNEDILENFRDLNGRYGVFDKDFRVLANR